MKALQRLALLLPLLLAVGGCTHAMRVRDLDAYVKNVTADRRAIIALEDRSTSPESAPVHAPGRVASGLC